MSPTNLGNLPSNEPVPTGKVQIRRGAGNYSLAAPANNSPMLEAPGSPWPMYISLSTPPTRGGWWVVRAENIFILADAAWYYFAWYINLAPADANGVSIEYGHHRLHSALGWQHCCIDAAFKLNPNTYYEATMYFRDRQAGTVNYFTGSEYCMIAGEFIAEGSI